MDETDHSTNLPDVGWRAALRTIRLAVRLVWSAAPRETLLTLVLTVVGALLTGAELLIGRELVNLLVDGNDVDAADLLPWLVLLGVSLVATSLVNASTAELRILLSELVQRRAVDQLLEVSTAVELEAFEDPGFHDRIRLAREHADTYAWQVVWGLVTFMTTAFSGAVIILVLLGVAPLLVPIALVAFIPIAVVNVRNTRALYRMHYGLAELDRDRSYHERLLTDRLEAREVRAFGLAGWLRARHDDLFAERVRNTRLVVKKRTVLALIGSSITAVILVVSLAIVMLLALDERISVADAAVAVVALQQLASRLRSSGAAMESLVEGVTFVRDFESFRALLPAAGAATLPSVAVPTNPIGGGARCRRVHVPGERHGGAPRREHAAATRAGDRHRRPEWRRQEHARQAAVRAARADVGPHPVGRRRCCHMLARRVRALVAPVFQDFTRFEHTAREAIGFGDIDRLDDDAAIHDAARRAGADEFIDALADGYDTRLSTSFSNGTELSVGQWQRIAIARAFFRDAPLVVMDEPAASLDARAERDLFERLTDLGRDRMVVFISHRFATVRRADHIIVLLDGCIAEQGNHDELMALGGVYAELYEMQAERFS